MVYFENSNHYSKRFWHSIFFRRSHKYIMKGVVNTPKKWNEQIVKQLSETYILSVSLGQSSYVSPLAEGFCYFPIKRQSLR